MDPNRDFPFHNLPNKCMNTIAARVINEVWREHIFQISVTFHGGAQSISYEWGDKEHIAPNDICPDGYALKDVALRMTEYASGIPEKKIEKYEVDVINDIVYSVRGGMEDWGYAGSWAKPWEQVSCSPVSFGGYDSNKTIYEDPKLRAFNYLVETSRKKTPLQENLGKTEHVLDISDPPGNGHITRDIRIVLFLTDIVKPCVFWSSEDENHPEHLHNNTNSTYSWEVGGALTVDTSCLLVGPWPSNVVDRSKVVPDDVLSLVNFVRQLAFILLKKPRSR